MNFKNLSLIVAFSGLLIAPVIVAQEVKSAPDVAVAKPAEEFKPSGKAEGRIYADFSRTLNQPESGTQYKSSVSGFELKRAYFGYSYQFAPVWSAKVLLDLTNDEPNIDRGVYVKNAFVQYKKGSLTGTFGIHDTQNFKYFDKIFGKRYLQNPYYDQFKYYTSADLGASAEYTLGDYTVDLSVYNGEGFRRAQSDNGYRTGLGITGKFVDKKLTARLFADYLSKEYQQSSIEAFLSYQVADKFTVGVDAIFQYHPDYSKITNTISLSSDGKTVGKTTYSELFARDKNHYGGTIFATYYINKTWNVFGRFDYSKATSFTDSNSYAKNNFLTGNQVIAGIEYVYSKNLRFAADYQGLNSDLGGVTGEIVSKAFVHVDVAF